MNEAETLRSKLVEVEAERDAWRERYDRAAHLLWTFVVVSFVLGWMLRNAL